jgi:hypothetical protein
MKNLLISTYLITLYLENKEITNTKKYPFTFWSQLPGTPTLYYETGVRRLA